MANAGDPPAKLPVRQDRLGPSVHRDPEPFGGISGTRASRHSSTGARARGARSRVGLVGTRGPDDRRRVREARRRGARPWLRQLAPARDMAEDRYRSIHNIDISAVVIEQQRERYQGHPHERFISFQHMNACALEFPDETFDAVIAKVRAAELSRRRALSTLSRCLPAGARRRRDVWRGARGERREHVHGGEGRRPSAVCWRRRVTPFCAQVSRVLKPNGIFMIAHLATGTTTRGARVTRARPWRCGAVSHAANRAAHRCSTPTARTKISAGKSRRSR